MLCDCLKPVFRKDEESAWTIVASGGHSSVSTSETKSSVAKDDKDSIHSIRHFSFTNDLLTAPVYRRLTLNVLSRPKTVPNPTGASSSAATGDLSQLSAHRTPSKPFPSRGPTTPAIRTQSTTLSNHSHAKNHAPNFSALIDQAAGGAYSSSTVSDLEWLRGGPSSLQVQRYLPIAASLKRGEMTVGDRTKLDLQLINATTRGSVDEMAMLLDNGADINAARSRNCQTLLQIALLTHQAESVIFFLLLYRNVNIYVRDCFGRSLLHYAVSLGRVQIIPRLVDLGLSMTEGDANRITPFNVAVGKFNSAAPLSTLLKYARNQGASDDAITKMEPTALHRTCVRNRIFAVHASLLLEYGWSPGNRFLTKDGGNIEWVSPLYLAILKKEIVLVGKMLELPKDVVRVNEVHGPTPDLLGLAFGPRVDCPKIVLLLLRAGIAYNHFSNELNALAQRHNDSTLLKWLHEEKVEMPQA
jgi:ankyrin repeat protein